MGWLASRKKKLAQHQSIAYRFFQEIHISNMLADGSDCDDYVLWLRSRGWRMGTRLISSPGMHLVSVVGYVRVPMLDRSSCNLWLWPVFMETLLVLSVGCVV